ncbi:hypothetical protein A1O3_03334, partial [Capronia epimyces CBS 606.96]
MIQPRSTLIHTFHVLSPTKLPSPWSTRPNFPPPRKMLKVFCLTPHTQKHTRIPSCSTLTSSYHYTTTSRSSSLRWVPTQN